MSKDYNITEEEKDRAIKFLKALITVRNLPLLFLGITTIALVYPMANGWTLKNIGIGFLAGFVANIITIIVYGAFDGSLELTLKFIDGTKPRTGNRKFFYAIVFMGCLALAGTGTLSIWSSPIIVALTDDSKDVTGDTKQLLKQKLENDKKATDTKAKALESAISTQGARIEGARKKAIQLEKTAAKTTHNSWYKDYLAAKNNPQHWFWTCKKGGGCPQGYINYREGILAARAQGEKMIIEEQNLVSKLTIPENYEADPTLLTLTQMVKTDSVIVARGLALENTKTKALIMIELACLVLVFLLTVVIQVGKSVYEVEIKGEFVTLFSALEMGIMKILNVLFALYKAAIDAIDAQKVQDFTTNLVSVTVSAGGNWVGGKLKETKQKLAIIEEQKQALELEKEKAIRKAEEARQALELEKEQLRQALEKEKIEKEAENARMALEKLEKEKLEREKKRESKPRKPTKNKALEENDATKVEKKVKDRILNSIRYRFTEIKALDSARDATKIAEHKARINEIVADKNNGLAFLEANGYNCYINFETMEVGAKLK